jgi:hypothetical protein
VGESSAPDIASSIQYLIENNAESVAEQYTSVQQRLAQSFGNKASDHLNDESE